MVNNFTNIGNINKKRTIYLTERKKKEGKNEKLNTTYDAGKASTCFRYAGVKVVNVIPTLHSWCTYILLKYMKIYGVKICYSPILKNQLKPISFLFIMSILDLICLKPIGYLYQFEHLYQWILSRECHIIYPVW